MYCVECGKEKTIHKDGVCLDCYLISHTFTNGPNLVEIQFCPHCGSYKYKNTWSNDLFSDVIRRVIKDVFEIKKEIKKIDITTDCSKSSEGMKCKVFISGLIKDKEITEEHDINVRLKKTVCDICSRMFGGYHEAILQIRAADRELTNDELEDIELTIGGLVENQKLKGNRTVFVTDVGKEHGGIDFYLSDKQAALAIINKLKEKYGGEIKKSSKNIGMKDGKQIYRMTFLLRLPSFKKGDFLKFENKYYLIDNTKGNRVKMVNLSNWEEESYDFRELQKAITINGKESIKEMIVVSQKDDEIQLMDKDNYQLKIIKKPKKVNFNQEKIKIILIEDQFFVFPKI